MEENIKENENIYVLPKICINLSGYMSMKYKKEILELLNLKYYELENSYIFENNKINFFQKGLYKRLGLNYELVSSKLFYGITFSNEHKYEMIKEECNSGVSYHFIFYKYNNEILKFRYFRNGFQDDFKVKIDDNYFRNLKKIPQHSFYKFKTGEYFDFSFNYK